MEKNVKLGEAVYLNNLINNSKFNKELKDSSISDLLEFKFQLSKFSKEKDDFIKESIESLKSDRFKELQEKENKSQEETKELEALTQNLDRTLNITVSKFLIKDVVININKIDSSEFLLFCKSNDFTIQDTEFLYNLLVL